MATFITEFYIGLRDLLAIVFRPKIFPECRVPLKRRWEKEDKGSGWHSETRGFSLKIDHGNKTVIRLKYYCAICDQSFLPRHL